MAGTHRLIAGEEYRAYKITAGYVAAEDYPAEFDVILSGFTNANGVQYYEIVLVDGNGSILVAKDSYLIIGDTSGSLNTKPEAEFLALYEEIPE